MVKKLKIDGLNCANCANKIELELKDLPWIEDANLNFAMGNIFLNVKDSSKFSLSALQKIANDIEDGISILDGEEENIEKKSINWGLIRLVITLPLFIAGLIISNTYIKLPIIFAAYILSGYDVILRAFKNLIKGNLFDEFFLMTIATIGAFILAEYSEGVGVMIFFQIGEYVQDLAVGRSKKSIKSLMSIKPEFVRLTNGKIISPEEAKVGDDFEVRPGEKVPLDGVIIKGKTLFDTKTLTGESMPSEGTSGDNILSGYINISDVITVKAEKEYKNSAVSRILEMVENESSKKSNTESFISKFAKIYTPIVVILALLVAVISGGIYKALIFLVISCPCALVISVPLGYFSGIGRASKEGILIKGSIYMEVLNNIKTFAFDKTGTLTKGIFKVDEVKTSLNTNRDELLEAAYITENKSNHPIAKAIINHTGKLNLEDSESYKEVIGNGIQVTHKNNFYFAGKKDFLIDYGLNIPKEDSRDETTVYFSKNNNYLGFITLKDELKPDVKDMVKKLGNDNIYMLTGDNEKTARTIGAEAGIKNIKHSMLPHNKAEYIKNINSNNNVLFAGDGINDSPVLAAASVGVAMGGLGSDAAIEASDIVIMTDEPSKVISAVKIAKYTRKIIIGNIIMALGFKIIIMILGLLGFAGLWLAIFADVGVSLIAVLNSVRTLKLKL